MREFRVLLTTMATILLVSLLLPSFGWQETSASVANPIQPTTVRAADQFKRLKIVEADVYASIQVLSRLPDGTWEEPNHVSAWVLQPHPGVFYMHRDGLGSRLDELRPGSKAFLYEDWLMETEPLQLMVFKLETIEAKNEPLVWERAGGDVFALITCHPEGDLTAPQRLVIWAVAFADQN